MKDLPKWVKNALDNCQCHELWGDALVLEARLRQLEAIRRRYEEVINEQVATVEPMDDDNWPDHNYRCRLCGRPRRRLGDEVHEDHCIVHMLDEADHTTHGEQAMRNAVLDMRAHMLNDALGLDEQRGLQREEDLYIVPFRRYGNALVAKVSYRTVLSDWHDVRLLFFDVNRQFHKVEAQARCGLRDAKEAARAEEQSDSWVSSLCRFFGF